MNRIYGILILMSFLAVAVNLILLPDAALAEVTLDGTIGPAGVLAGPDYVITPDLGQQRGMNLFHSFDSFSLDFGESATFTGPETIQNIIARVTGGDFSYIDGVLRLEAHGADMYFINPSGIVFGPHANVEIPGSFHVSTADYLLLGETGRFDVSAPHASVLVSAPPYAYGFLSSSPADISFQGNGVESQYPGENGVSVPYGKNISIICGDIFIGSGRLLSDGRDSWVQTRLIAPEGEIRMAAVGSPGEVIITETGIETDSFSAMKDIHMNAASEINTSGVRAGNMYIRAGNFYMKDGSTLASAVSSALPSSETSGTGAESDGRIDIRLSGDLFIENGSSVIMDNFGAGDGADLYIEGENIFIREGGFISGMSMAVATGNAAEVKINSGNFILENGSEIDVSSFGSGCSGHIFIAARDDVSLSESNILAQAESVEGNGSGAVNVEAGSIELSGESFISNSSLGKGNQGEITLHSITLSLSEGSMILADTAGDGNGSDMDINVDSLTLTDGSQITSASFGKGNAGSIHVDASEYVFMSGKRNDLPSGLFTSSYDDGAGGNIMVNTPFLHINDEGSLQAGTTGKGNAGEMFINADSLQLRNGGGIQSDSTGIGDAGGINIVSSGEIHMSGGEIWANSIKGGDGGNISILSGSLSLDEGSKIAAISIGEGDAGEIQIETGLLGMSDNSFIIGATTRNGDAGDIDIKADALDISGDSQIAATTFGKGNGGNVNIAVTDYINLSGGYLNTGTESDGAGGNIRLESGFLDIDENSVVSSSSSGAGNAGNIFIAALDSVSMINGFLTTEAESSDGGNITVETCHMLTLRDSQITTSVNGGEGRGGNIDIDAVHLVLDNSFIIANAMKGDGGNINIAADVFLADPDSLIDASSRLGGLDGIIRIASPERDITGGLSVLPETFFDVSSLLTNACSAKNSNTKSSIFILGRKCELNKAYISLPGIYNKKDYEHEK